MFLLVSCSLSFSIPFVFCAWLRQTNKRNREQKHVTKKLASFITSLTLSTMVKTKLTMVMYNLKAAVKIEPSNDSFNFLSIIKFTILFF